MTNELEIYKTLVVSAAHLEELDLYKLSGTTMVGSRDTGAFIKLYVEEELVHEMCCDRQVSQNCTDLLVFALRRGFRMVEVDCDGPIVIGLPVHEWHVDINENKISSTSTHADKKKGNE